MAARPERRPAPAPVETDDRRAITAGLVAWVIGLVVVLVAGSTLGDPGFLVATCVIGVALGVAGLVYTQVRTRRAARERSAED
jgi:uncharacterized membrane protein YdjX (TVP38/TMEM64 family)